LIQNSSNFDVGLDLIKNAIDLVENKLQGVKITEQYLNSLIRLRSQCVLKIEEKCVELVSEYLESVIKADGPNENTTKMLDEIEAAQGLPFLRDQILENWNLQDCTQDTDFTAIQSCISSIFKTDSGNTLGANIDNLLLSLKRSHSNALKSKNDELLAFLQQFLIKVCKKGGDSSPLTSLLKNNPEITSGKNSMKHLV